jgi:hypothetical protein
MCIAPIAHLTNQSALQVVVLMGLLTMRHYALRVKVGKIEPWAHYQCLKIGNNPMRKSRSENPSRL